MSSRFAHTSSLTKAIIIVEFLLVGYLIYSLTKNVYDSYTLDSHIEEFKAENAQLEAEIQQKSDDYLYFTSEEYLDRIAKQNLGLVNPGEEVLIISDDALAEEVPEEEDLSEFARYVNMSTREQWWEFFFGG